MANKLQQSFDAHTEVQLIHHKIYDSILSTSVALTTLKDIKELKCPSNVQVCILYEARWREAVASTIKRTDRNNFYRVSDFAPLRSE